MTTYNILGGGTIKADSNNELVQKLNESSMFGKRKTIDEFMNETAKACQVQTGVSIRITSIDAFVEDLIKAGFLVAK